MGIWGWWTRVLARAESIAASPPPAQVELARLAKGSIPILSPPPAELEPFAGPLSRLPRNRSEVYQVFGNPGGVKVDRRWERASLMVAKKLPGRWNKGKGRLYVHRLVEPYIREALFRCDQLGVLDYIEKLGCFSPRHQRHDPRRPLSYHTWAIAFDINSGQNSSRVMGKAPEPFSAAWRKLWPDGVPEQLVRAFESVGFSWGGRWPTFPDPMHFELVS